MAIIAKFHIQSVAKVRGSDLNGKPCMSYSISGFPVYGGSKENENFFHATPGGKLELQVLNEDAGKQFEPGDERVLGQQKLD
jgi:hypothetical protein